MKDLSKVPTWLIERDDVKIMVSFYKRYSCNIMCAIATKISEKIITKLCDPGSLFCVWGNRNWVMRRLLVQQ